jgi:hypothetical protein
MMVIRHGSSKMLKYVPILSNKKTETTNLLLFHTVSHRKHYRSFIWLSRWTRLKVKNMSDIDIIYTSLTNNLHI